LAPCHNEGCCVRCGRRLTESASLELDQRVNEYHDFGVPAEYSQGWFDFGTDCADALRIRARYALASIGATA
jgi:hypothetical protein